MKNLKIKTVAYETENGTVELGVRNGCFGAWVAVRENRPVGTCAIRPLQWVQAPRSASKN